LPRIFSAALAQELARIASDHVLTVAMQLDIPGGPGAYRIINYDQSVTFHGSLFTAYPMDVDVLEETTSDALAHVRVTAANVDQQIQSLLENYWRNDPHWQVTIWQLDVQQPNETPFATGSILSVESVETDLLTAVFDLVCEGYTLGTLLPKRRYNATNGFKSIPRKT
jgi:hypothetical protein